MCLLVAPLLLALGSAGCRPLEAPREAARGGEVLGLSLENRPIRAFILGRGSPTCLIVGGIHGDEPLGRRLVERFLEHCRARPELTASRRLVFIPAANPDGLARRTRANARGVDLNRNFPARNWRPGPRHGPRAGSEPETRALLKIIRQLAPDRILSVHSPLRMVNYDGPAAPLARRMAKACGYPVAAAVGYPTPGSLGSYAGVDWGTPTITLELGREATRGNLWPRFREALEEFARGR